MMSQNKTIAQMAAELSGDPTAEVEVQDRINNSRLTTMLTKARLQKKVSQKSVAEHMGCDQSKVSRLESGCDDDWGFTDVGAYAAALGCRLSVCLDDKDMPEAARIKHNVMLIKQSLDALTTLALDSDGDASIINKINEFHGEVLLNFLINIKESHQQLPTMISLGDNDSDEHTQATDKHTETKELAHSG